MNVCSCVSCVQEQLDFSLKPQASLSSSSRRKAGTQTMKAHLTWPPATITLVFILLPRRAFLLHHSSSRRSSSLGLAISFSCVSDFSFFPCFLWFSSFYIQGGGPGILVTSTVNVSILFSKVTNHICDSICLIIYLVIYITMHKPCTYYNGVWTSYRYYN